MKFKYFIILFLITNFALSQKDTSLERRIQIKIRESLLIASGQYNALAAGGGIGLPLPLALEQDCNYAIPVCQNVYSTTASYSGHGTSQEIPSNSSCLGSQEKNSVWYTFTTGSSGNLAFNITPNNMGNDYDFALYDITGNNCSAISSGAITPIRCNFAANSGVTGLSSSGTNASEPASGSNQSSVLATSPGRTYVLIISNYSSSQSGYTLDFSPGTASIFDNIPPTLANVTAPCGSSTITFNASEQIKCSSIASNGSDFTVSGTGGPYTVSGATGLNCGANTAQVSLNISPALSGSGPWTIGVIAGSDGNTLIDACGNPMAPNTLTFTTIPPTVSISGPSSICRGSNLALTASSASSYTWNGSAVPAGQQNQQTISLIANTAGTLNFTVTVTNGTCGNSSATKAVTVTDAPQANFSILPSATVCAGTPVSFTNTSTYPCSSGGLGLNQCTCGAFLCNPTSNQGTFVTYLWTFGDGGTAFYILGIPANNFSPTYTYNNPGTYDISLTASGLINTCSNTKNLTITVLPAAANLTVSPTQTICPGESATITATGGSTYTWNPGGITTSTTVVSPGTTTTYTVSSPGCSSTQTQTTQVVVSSTPPNLGNVLGLGSVCPNQTGVTYSVNNVGGATYSWQVPPGASITSTPTNSNAITVDFGATAGSVIATASTACGTATSIVVVAVTPNPTITMPASMTVCPGQSVTLTMTGPGSYTWAPGSSLSSTTGSVVTASPSVTTIYSVSTDGCGTPVTGTVEIAVSGDPPNLGYINGPTTVCSNALSNLSYSVANIAGTNYTWTVPPGANITSSPVNSHSITMNMGTSSGSVIVTAANACGTATSIVTVNLAPNPTITVTPDQSICPGEFALLGAGGAATFTWMPGNLTTQTISVNPSSTTIYTVTGDNGVCLGTNTVQVSPASNPVLSISQGATVCPGSSATFTVGGATNYTWTPNIYLNNDNTATVISTPNASTNYTVIGANGSCQSTATVNIVVNNTVVVTASAANPTICPLSGTNLTASGATSYTWSPSLTLSSNTGAVVLASPAFSTTYTVIGSTGTCTNSAQVVVTATTNPIITPASNPTICSGSTAGLNVSGANSYTWTASPSLSATGIANPIASPSTTTTYSVSGSSPLGCVGSTVVTVNVIPTPTISMTSAPSSASICAGQSITLNAFGAASYTWSPAASVSNITGSSTTATPNQTTIYTVIGSNGTAPNVCTSSRTIQVTVKPNTVVSISPRDSVCLGSNTLMYANGGNTYNWSPSSGVISPNDSVTFVSPLSTTIYTVTASINGECPGTATVEIVVNPLPSVNAGLDTTVNIDETVTLFGTGNVPVGFTSADGSPMPCNFCPIVTVNPQNNTCYILTGTNGHGCSNTDEVCITVTKDWNVYIPNAFTPNGDVDNEVFIPVGYGIEEIKLWIFDRWGHEIFRSNDQSIGWDGTNKGKVCPQDVYIYQAEIKTMSGKKVKRTGHVTLLGKVR